MDAKKPMIYYLGKRYHLLRRLEEHFSWQYDIIHVEKLFDIKEKQTAIAVVVDMTSIALNAEIKQSLLADLPIFGISEKMIVYPNNIHLDAIIELDTNPLKCFDLLEKALLKHRKIKNNHRTDHFQHYLINQYVQDPDFIENLQYHYQPIYNFREMTFDRIELFMRLPKIGQFGINEFINGIDDPKLLDNMTLKQCELAAELMDKVVYCSRKPFSTYINLSANQLQNDSILDDIQFSFKNQKNTLKNFHFEIHLDECKKMNIPWEKYLAYIQGMEARASIKCKNLDDIDRLKLRELDVASIKVKHHDLNKIEEELLNDRIHLIKGSHTELIAEQVETVQHLDFIKKNTIDLAQGYYFSKPLSANHLLNSMSA